MRALDACKVDAFTTTPLTGNISGVVPDAAGLSEAEMQAIAREMNVSETGFVLPSSAKGADLRLRFFTPTSEVKLCGHATVASFHLLVERGRVKPPARLMVETGAGVLPVDVREGGEVLLTSDPVVIEPSPFTPQETARLLGISEKDLHPSLPILLVKRKLLVPLAGLKAMDALKPDMPAIARARHEKNVDGIVPLSLETFSHDARTHIRYFVPGVGIDEDPVTGTAHMSLGGYLVHTGQIDLSRGPVRFIGEQGHFLKRPGQVVVEIEGDPRNPTVRAGGRAVTTLSGVLRLPA